MELSGERTMTALLQQWTTWSAMRYLTDNAIAGAVVECGVWRGGNAQIAARTLVAAGDTSRDIFLFDTFEGMTAPTDADFDIDSTAMASEILAAGSTFKTLAGVELSYDCIADIDDVRVAMEDTDYPMQRVHLVRGRVEDTIPASAPEFIAFLRLDTDWYESTRHELLHLWDRIVPNGVLVVDDYDAWRGARRATDEFFEVLDFKPFPMRPGSGRVYVKPSGAFSSSSRIES
jgi:hypothetical protein